LAMSPPALSEVSVWLHHGLRRLASPSA
jgi:hypothetical protein